MPKKSELSGWQISTRENFPYKVRKSFFCDKIKCVNWFLDKKYINLQFDLQIKRVFAVFVTSPPFYAKTSTSRLKTCYKLAQL